MKPNFSGFAHRAQRVLLLACATAPAAAIAAAGADAAFLTRIALFPPAYALLALLCLPLGGRLRLPLGLCAAAAMAGAGVVSLLAAGNVVVLLVPVGYAALLLSSLPMAAWPRERELFPAWYVVGLVLHALAQMMCGVARRMGRMHALLAAQPWLLLGFVLFLLLSTLSLNRIALHYATLGRQRLPLTVRVKNRLLIVGFLALALLIACAPGVAAAITAAWKTLLALIATAVRWLMALFASRETSGGGGGGGGFDLSGGLEEAEPGLLALLLERLLLALALVAAVLLAALLLRLLWRRLRALLRALADRLARFAAAAGEDYVDEITDTREDGAERSALRRMRGRIDWTDDRRLPPAARIRRRYLRLRLRHSDWRGSQTARETLPDDAAELYERARYSAHEVSSADAEAFKDRIKRC